MFGIAMVLDDYITDVLMRDLVGHDRRTVSFLIYLWLTAAQARAGKEVQVSFQEIAESVGVSKSSAQAAVRWLIQRKLLHATKVNATAVPRYKALAPWKDGARRGRGGSLSSG
jgi:response regulator of citrate/malate metabolism